MKIKYEFVTGEKVYIDVNEEFGEIMLELDNELKNNNHRETEKHKSLSLSDRNIEIADLNSDIFEEAVKNINKDKLYKAISDLKPYEQELLHSLYLRKCPLTLSAYAKVLGVTEDVIRKRLTNIKNKLRNLL